MVIVKCLPRDLRILLFAVLPHVHYSVVGRASILSSFFAEQVLHGVARPIAQGSARESATVSSGRHTPVF